jgi:hypothetical protein
VRGDASITPSRKNGQHSDAKSASKFIRHFSTTWARTNPIKLAKQQRNIFGVFFLPGLLTIHEQKKKKTKRQSFFPDTQSQLLLTSMLTSSFKQKTEKKTKAMRHIRNNIEKKQLSNSEIKTSSEKVKRENATVNNQKKFESDNILDSTVVKTPAHMLQYNFKRNSCATRIFIRKN